MKGNWLSLSGNVEISAAQLVFVSSSSSNIFLNIDEYPYAVAKSDIWFEQGEVTFDVMLEDRSSRCYLILNHDLSEQLSIGLNIHNNAYGICTHAKSNFTLLAGTGSSSNLPVNEFVRLKVTILGSQIYLYVNGIKVCNANYNVNKSQIALFFQAERNITVKNINVTTSKPSIFIVMQFTDEYNDLYSHVIEPVCKERGYECIRADDMYTNGLIIEDITRSIKESSIIIADITPNNLNVFYEVGYAHGIGKPTILLSDKKREGLPFDVSAFRTIFYDNSIGGKNAVEVRLKKHLDSMALSSF